MQSNDVELLCLSDQPKSKFKKNRQESNIVTVEGSSALPPQVSVRGLPH